MRGRSSWACLIAVVAWAAPVAGAQEAVPPSAAPPLEASPSPPPAPEPFRFWGEVKTDLRNSRLVETNTFTPTGPGPFRFIPTGHQRTVDPGTALELQNVSLVGEGDLGAGVSARVELHALDLYNRNPTSTDDRVFVRQAWLRLGRKAEALQDVPESRLYVLAGVAPRFSKPAVRALESYGMWATAVGRFENPQLQIGGALGRHAYWRAQAGRANPLFFRDTNVLAGDNGVPPPTPPATSFDTGFPIFYDAKMAELDVHTGIEWGAGLGWRRRPAAAESAPSVPAASGLGLDVLGWYFQRRLEDAVPLRGTSLLGDLDLLRGQGYPLPFEGRDKSEGGLNLSLRYRGLRLDSQLVRQDIASLVRRGFDAELGLLFPLPGLFLVGETPVGNWIRPVLRVSLIDNRFDAPITYPWLSADWDWRKYDFGFRFGLLREVDLTVEYSRHDMVVPRVGTLHPDEFLTTLRFGVRP